MWGRAADHPEQKGSWLSAAPDSGTQLYFGAFANGHKRKPHRFEKLLSAAVLGLQGNKTHPKPASERVLSHTLIPPVVQSEISTAAPGVGHRHTGGLSSCQQCCHHTSSWRRQILAVTLISYFFSFSRTDSPLPPLAFTQRKLKYCVFALQTLKNQQDLQKVRQGSRIELRSSFLLLVLSLVERAQYISSEQWGQVGTFADSPVGTGHISAPRGAAPGAPDLISVNISGTETKGQPG